MEIVFDMEFIKSEADKMKKRSLAVDKQILKRSKAKIRPSVIKSLETQGFDEKMHIVSDRILEIFAEDCKHRDSCIGCNEKASEVVAVMLRDFIPDDGNPPRFSRCCSLSELYNVIVGMNVDRFIWIPFRNW
ncbi:MAG: hypothetical protein WC022_00250 [Parcubacteria group bacterium]